MKKIDKIYLQPAKSEAEQKMLSKKLYGETCLILGGDNPNWHHIFSRGSRPDLRLVPANLIPLTYEIHMAFHNRRDFITGEKITNKKYLDMMCQLIGEDVICFLEKMGNQK